MKLKEQQEIVGTLEKYTIADGGIRLLFQVYKTIELPKCAIPKEELDDCVDRKIAIFNNSGEYRLKKYPRALETFLKEECPVCVQQKGCSKEGLELFNCLLKRLSEASKKK